jgi:hypothetical protein
VRAVSTFIAAAFHLGCVGPLSEDFESHYATVSEARQQDALGDHRWIPPIVPDGATDIFEFHNIDTNATWGCFRLNGGADRLLVLLHDKAARASSGAVSDGPRRWFRDRPWWPESMTTDRVEVAEFTEPGPPAAMTVRVGLDRAADVACFRRRR